MSKNIDQVYIANPITSNASTDLMYFGQSPYGVGNDAAMTYANFSAQFGAPFTPAALTEVNDTNVTLTLGGTPATSLLKAVSLTLGWTGTLSLARGGTAANLTASAGSVAYSSASAIALSAVGTSGQLLASAGTSAPGWTTNTFPSTDAKGDILYASATNTISGLAIGSTGNILTVASGLPAWTTATYPSTTTINQILYSSSANVVGGISTLDNGVLITSATGVPELLANGTAGYALVAQSGAPPAWAAVGGAYTASALTESNDTNVTLSLGGTPSTALLQAVSITAGWTGTLSLARGGTGANLTASNGGIFYSTGSAGAILAGTATAGQLLTSGASTTPAWTTSTYPATNAANTLLYASSANTMAALATTNNATLTTTAGGVPTWLAQTDGQLIIGSSAGAPAAATITAGTGVSITNGHNTITVGLSGSSGIVSWTAASSTPITATVNTGYYITDASQVTITLPATAAAGSIVAIVGNGAGGWILQPGSGQTIKIIGSSASTSITSAEQYDCIEVLCVVANTTWVARSLATTGFTIV